MLKIRLRVSPCRARCSPRSEGRLTVTSSSVFSTVISALTRWVSSPFGPLTRTSSGSTETITPSGRAIGCLPIRLIGYQTFATSSPPTPARRASWPVITPREVETIVVPMPPCTLGTSPEPT